MKIFATSLVTLTLQAPPAFAGGDAQPSWSEHRGGTLPAVSAPNGRVEVKSGVDTHGMDQPFVGAVAGTISLPAVHSVGLQLDAGLSSAGKDYVVGGAFHAFVRDPSAYLVGVSAGVVRTSSGTTVVAAGPAAELYRGNLSIEGWAGIAQLSHDSPAHGSAGGGFAIGELAWYVTDDWRLAIGGSYVFDAGSVGLSSEYHLPGQPVAITANLALSQANSVTALVGLKGYIGSVSDKTLIDRDREDSARNFAADLFDISRRKSLAVTTPAQSPNAGSAPNANPPVNTCQPPMIGVGNACFPPV